MGQNNMTQSERQEIAKIWVGLAELNGKQFSEMALTLMLNAIEDLNAQDVKAFMFNWSRTSKQNRHPLPSEIRTALHPEQNKDQDAEAREAASRIVEAVSKYGYSNPDEAKNYVGELGWHIVKRFGGWGYVCENLGTNLPITMFQAQARDIAKSTLIRGPNANAPSLPEAKNDTKRLAVATNPIMNANDLNKVIEGKNNG